MSSIPASIQKEWGVVSLSPEKLSLENPGTPLCVGLHRTAQSIGAFHGSRGFEIGAKLWRA